MKCEFGQRTTVCLSSFFVIRPASFTICLSPFAFVVFISSLLFLSSCSTTREAASPRAGYGIASWYGREFNGRPTASGEIFDMYARTCAHKEYPFGTILKVTNVSNNKNVRCVVNDRGPFVAGRDIDLSYGTAQAIGLLSTGKVFIDVEGRDESYVRKVNVQAKGMAGPFAVQVGSFTDRSNADRLRAALELEYGNVYIQEMKVKGDRHFRVRVGNFESLKKAIDFAGKLGMEGYPTLVVRADPGSRHATD